MPSAPPPPPQPSPSQRPPAPRDAPSLDPGSPREGESSLLVRVGSGIGAAAVAAAISVLPATLRLSGATDATALRIWLSLVALAIVPMAVSVLVLRGARTGLRAFAGPDAPSKTLGLAVWFATLFVFLVPFGSMLRATTHQHALAGVTYAIGALVVAASLAVLCARLARIVADRTPPVRRVLTATIAGLVVAALAYGVFRVTRGGALPASLGAEVVDALAFVLAALFASKRTFVEMPKLAIAGPPLAAMLLVIGVSSLRGSPAIDGSLAERAPAYDALAAAVRPR